MKVLLVNNSYSAAFGGTETVMLATEKLLQQRGHAVAPFAIGDRTSESNAWSKYFPDREILQKRITRSAAQLTGVYSFETRRALTLLVRDFRPDVAHLHNVYEKLTLSVIDALETCGIPFVMTLHDYRAVCPNGRLFSKGDICHQCTASGHFHHIIWHRCLEGSLARNTKAAAEALINRIRHQYEKANELIAPSCFLKETLTSAGVPANKLTVIPNPVAIASDHSPRSPNPPRFAYVGRLVPEKGLDVLLTAAGRLGARARLVIIGAGLLERHLERRIAEEEIPADLLGYLPSERVAEELCRSTAAIVPSLWYENCPMSILEASACGVPVITSDLGGMRELVSDGHNGLLVAPGDVDGLAAAMTRLVDDASLARRMGAVARERVRTRHSSGAYIRALLSCYERALDSRPLRQGRPRRSAPRALGSLTPPSCG